MASNEKSISVGSPYQSSGVVVMGFPQKGFGGRDWGGWAPYLSLRPLLARAGITASGTSMAGESPHPPAALLCRESTPALLLPGSREVAEGGWGVGVRWLGGRPNLGTEVGGAGGGWLHLQVAGVRVEECGPSSLTGWPFPGLGSAEVQLGPLNLNDSSCSFESSWGLRSSLGRRGRTWVQKSSLTPELSPLEKEESSRAGRSPALGGRRPGSGPGARLGKRRPPFPSEVGVGTCLPMGLRKGFLLFPTC